MAEHFKRIGDYISVIDNRNLDSNITKLMGISIDKCYIPSVANVIGTDLKNYKIIRKGQFACSLMQVSRDQRIPIAMYRGVDPAIMSPAYVMFEVNRHDELISEYLELWFMRAEFDREASFYAIGGVRGSLDWEDFCNMKFPVPPIDEQRKIVRDYQVMTERISLLRQMNEILEETEQLILFKTLSMEETPMTPLGDFAEFIDGDRGKNYPTFDEFYEEGYCLFLNAANVTSDGFDFENCTFVTEEKDRSMNKGHLCRYDIVLTSRGTLGNVAFYDDHIPYQNVRINSGMLIIRPKNKYISPYLLYALLKSEYMRIEIQKFKSGSAQPQLPIRDLQKVSFPLPVYRQDLVSLSTNLRITQETISLYTNEINTLKRAQRNVLGKMNS